MENRKIKRVLSIILCIMLIMSSIAYADAANTETAKYPDIVGNKYETQLREWIANGFIKGYPDGNFKPGNQVTRSEFMALVNRLYGFTETVEINYSDIVKNAWYYKDAAIATKAGYIQGAYGKLMPLDNISRQEMAVILARLTKNEKAAVDNAVINKLTDGKDIPAWSKAAVSTAMKNKFFEGFVDTTFKPTEKITRLEAVVALDRAFKSMYKSVYMSKGTYGPATGTQTLDGDVVIIAPEVTLKNTIIKRNLILRETIGEGNVYLDNVVVKGDTIVKGGGSNSIIIKNSTLGKVTVIKEGNTVRIVATGTTTIDTVNVGANAKLEEYELTGTGFNDVVVLEDIPEGANVIFEGNFDNVEIDSPNVNVAVENGTIGELTITENASNANLNLAEGAKVTTLTLDAAAKVTGKGSIGTANINANGAEIEQKPATVKLAEGVNATVGGQPAASTPAPVVGGGGGGGGWSSPNAAPVARNVTITGNAIVGETLTGSYTYSDAENNAEGNSIYKWYRASNADGSGKSLIPNATSRTYTVQEADKGMYLFFEVTPKAVSGTVTGAAVISPASNKVIALFEGAAAADYVVAENFNTHLGTDYRGVNVGFRLVDLNLSELESIEVSLFKGNELLATNTANKKLLALKGPNNKQHSTPFIVKYEGYTEEYWTPGEHLMNKLTKPTKAVITITDKYSNVYKVENNNLVEPNGITYESLFEKVITGDEAREYVQTQDFGYWPAMTGYNVGFKLNLEKLRYNEIQKIEVVLVDASGEELAKRTATGDQIKKLKDADDEYGDIDGQLSAAFIKRDESATNEYWDSTPYDLTVPAKAIVRITTAFDIYIVESGAPTGVPEINASVRVIDSRTVEVIMEQLEGATFTWNGKAVSNLTYEGGAYKLTVPSITSTTNTLVISKSGYNSRTETVTISESVGDLIIINNADELDAAITNQKDNQVWIIKPGEYVVESKYRFDIDSTGDNGYNRYYFPIKANNLTIIGEDYPVIYGSTLTLNGVRATQNFITVMADGVIIDGVTIMSKLAPNKAIEVAGDKGGKNFVFKNSKITKNTKVTYNNEDVDDYFGKIEKLTDDDLNFPGSLYFYQDVGNSVVENVIIEQGRISAGSISNEASVALKNVEVDYVGSVEAKYKNIYVPISTGARIAKVTADNVKVKVDNVSAHKLQDIIDNVPIGTTIELAAGIYYVQTKLNVPVGVNLDYTTNNATIEEGTAFVKNVSELNNALSDANITTIKLRAGNYDGNFKITRPLTVKASEEGAVINGSLTIDANDVTVEDLVVNGQIIVSRDHSNITIKDNKITYNNLPLSIRHNSKDVTVTTNTITGTNDNQILAYVDSGSENVDFTDNTFTGKGRLALGMDIDSGEVKGNIFAIQSNIPTAKVLEVFGSNIDVEGNNFNGNGLSVGASFVIAPNLDINNILTKNDFSTETKVEGQSIKVAIEPQVKTLDNPTLFGLVGSADKSAIGNGSWKANGNVLEFYISPTEITNTPIKISDIESISYKTNKAGSQSDVDFFFCIYTNKYDGDSGKWYGNRLNAEPMYFNNLNAPSNTWNEWSTDAGQNQMTFFDGDYGPMGFYGAPTLDKLQNEAITWRDGTVDYRNQTVMSFKIGTGSAWAERFTDAYLDEITISLKNGISVTFDLEPGQLEVNPGLQAINNAKNVTEIRIAVNQYKNELKIAEDALNKFNAMPQDQGRQQAVATAVIAAKPADGYSSAQDVAQVFEYFVNKEYYKYLFINAVDGAKDAQEMKSALETYVPVLHQNRQDLIQRLIAEGMTTQAEDLQKTTYTEVLAIVNAMISNGENIDSIAERLLAARNDQANKKFFGVINITDAINAILEEAPEESSAKSVDNVKTSVDSTETNNFDTSSIGENTETEPSTETQIEDTNETEPSTLTVEEPENTEQPVENEGGEIKE